VARKYQTVETLVQNYIFVPEKYKDCYLTYLVNEFSGNSIICFVAKCNSAQRLALMLRNLGFPAVPIHGKLGQSKRMGALNQFKTGNRTILIATDVASRGLDIPHVDLIINYDVSANSKDYVHRVGRTARAKNAGRAITIVTQYSVELFQKIEHLTGKTMELFPTEQDEVLVFQQRVLDAQRFAAMEMRESGFEKKRKRKKEGASNNNNKNTKNKNSKKRKS